MAIQPAQGYTLDPNNPNSVIRTGAPQPGGMQPAAQAPVTPAPTIATPATPAAPNMGGTPAPAPSTTINVGTPAPATPAPAPKQPLTYDPAVNPSVIDLLNSTGADSSPEARKALAQQYGIQGYTGTSAQNIDLAKKYTEAFNTLKGTEAPQTGAAADSALDSHFKENKDTGVDTTEQKLFDSIANMNPVVKNLYDQINTALSTPNTRKTYEEEFANAISNADVPAGVPGESLSQEQVKLMNIKNIMDGSEDDIRNEITSVGGFATESQVQALTAVRNKTLMKQASYLQQSMDLKQDYVDHLMQFSEKDRAQVEKDVDRKLGLTEKLADIQDKMQNAAKENYQKIVDTVGYVGLAQGLDTKGKAVAEKTLGLSPGALSNPAFLDMTKKSSNQTASIQEYEYAKSQGYKGSFSEYQNEDANRKAIIAKAGSGGYGLSPAQTSTALKLSDDYEARSKDFYTVRDAYNRIQEVAKDVSPAGDLALIFSYMKVLDPGSSVREGEFANAQNAGSAFDRIGALYNKVREGTRLTQSQRSDFMTQAKSLFTASQKQQQQTADEYSARADKFGVPADLVVRGVNATSADTPKAPSGGQIAVQDQKTHQIRYFPAGTDISGMDTNLYQVIGKTN